MKTRSADHNDDKFRRRLNSSHKTKEAVEETSSNSDEEPQEKEVAKPPKLNLETNRCKLYCIICFVLVVGLVPSYFIYDQYLGGPTTRPSIQEKLISNIRDLKKEFPAQSDTLWGHILHVVNISNSDSSCPRVVLMLNQGDEQSEASTNCLIDKVATSSAKILKREAIYLSSTNFTCDGCINKTRYEVGKDGPVVVIKQLENFPIKAAEALHFFCDENEPDFTKAAYLLTLKVESSRTEKAVRTAENTLRALWSKIREDSLNAIIARLTSLVEFVKPENNLHCAPL